VSGLGLSESTLDELVEVDPVAWRRELGRSAEYLEQIGAPAALRQELMASLDGL